MLRSLPVSRTTLLSVLTICATVAVFATGATFAITGSDSASGQVTAASAAISVNGTGAEGSLNFSVGTGCPAAMNPGNECADTVVVTNASGVVLSLTGPTHTISVTDVVNPVGCTDATTNWVVTKTPLGSSTLNPGDTTSFEVSVRLQALASAGCQGETATVTVTVNSAS